MKIPALHRQGDHEPTEEQKYQVVGVIRGDFLAGQDAQKRIKNQRQQRGHRHRHRFGNPPERHQQNHRGHALAFRRYSVRRRQHQHEQKEQDATDNKNYFIGDLIFRIIHIQYFTKAS